jgi:hypothetical protein
MPTPIAVNGTVKLSSSGRGKDSATAETKATPNVARYIFAVAVKNPNAEK